MSALPSWAAWQAAERRMFDLNDAWWHADTVTQKMRAAAAEMNDSGLNGLIGRAEALQRDISATRERLGAERVALGEAVKAEWADAQQREG